MGDVINLNRARKARERAAKGGAAAENRARFGRSGTDRETEAARQDHDARRLDAHRLGDDEPEPPKAG